MALRWPPSPALVRSATWGAIPLALACWVLSRRDHLSFFYDEWGLIDRVVFHPDSWWGLYEPFNGHLWTVNYLLYLVQVRGFGVVDHTPVLVALAASLVAFHLALAGLLRALGLPALVSVLAAGVVVYFGVGSQNMMFAIQTAPNLAYAGVLVGALLIVRHPPTPRAGTAVAVVGLATLLCDSATAALGAVLLGVLVLRRWRTRVGLLAWAAPVVAQAVWLSLVDETVLGPPSTVGEQLEFAGHLILQSAGGLLGGGEASGVVFLAGAGALIVAGLRGRYLRGLVLDALLGGTATAGVAVAVLARSRTAIVAGNLEFYNRYLQLVAVCLLVALLPLLHATLVRLGARAAAPVLACALVAVFAANVPPLLEYREGFEAVNVQARDRFVQSVAVLERGCPTGAAIDYTSRPIDYLSPQVTTELIAALVRDGRTDGLDASRTRVSPEVLRPMCGSAEPYP